MVVILRMFLSSQRRKDKGDAECVELVRALRGIDLLVMRCTGNFSWEESF
ncbi:hypothetical protein BRADI_2g52826v3 [Brachypodium distachyon]|uniref:Uncharacterized protein n=1 Tax=Brachypodium distachyon TaxID=15368 RepID=A0A2K2DFL2_BRADI|nr:hypothetical protein BRADI_2g52826v3 [Brachypodium distachyon]